MTKEELKQLRTAAGYTQEELAHAIERSVRTIASMEAGDVPIKKDRETAIRVVLGKNKRIKK